MTKRDIMVFLFKWKYSLIGYLVFVVAAVTVFVYLMPQKYDAAASVLIESNRAPVMRANPTLGIEEISVLNSEVAIIRSRTVLSAAVDKVGVGAKEEPPTMVELWLKRLSQWMEEVDLREPRTPRESMIEALEDDLVVSPLPASNVITLSLRGKSPQAVSALVNAVTDAYIAHHLKVFSSPGTADVMRQQLDRLGQDVNVRREEHVFAMRGLEANLRGVDGDPLVPLGLHGIDYEGPFKRHAALVGHPPHRVQLALGQRIRLVEQASHERGLAVIDVAYDY
jgi:capsular polysaccharide biosynthesis protein